jgi:hypothetical protein
MGIRRNLRTREFCIQLKSIKHYFNINNNALQPKANAFVAYSSSNDKSMEI